jgi:hypothetical protein
VGDVTVIENYLVVSDHVSQAGFEIVVPEGFSYVCVYTRVYPQAGTCVRLKAVVENAP